MSEDKTFETLKRTPQQKCQQEIDKAAAEIETIRDKLFRMYPDLTIRIEGNATEINCKRLNAGVNRAKCIGPFPESDPA
jgi:hypothetical protein